MPIEIRELVIKATVAQEGEEPAGSTSSSDSSANQKEEIINECVEAVLQILKEKHER
jgi:hypothetical protein